MGKITRETSKYEDYIKSHQYNSAERLINIVNPGNNSTLKLDINSLDAAKNQFINSRPFFLVFLFPTWIKLSFHSLQLPRLSFPIAVQVENGENALNNVFWEISSAMRALCFWLASALCDSLLFPSLIFFLLPLTTFYANCIIHQTFSLVARELGWKLRFVKEVFVPQSRINNNG